MVGVPPPSQHLVIALLHGLPKVVSVGAGYDEAVMDRKATDPLIEQGQQNGFGDIAIDPLQFEAPT